MSDTSCGCGCEAGKNPIDVLKEEHRVIEKVLGAMECVLNKEPLAGGLCPLDKSFWKDAVDFCRNFADGCHHAKEEGELFPVLEKAGMPRDGGPIGCMLKEHDEGRAFVTAVADHVDEAATGNRDAVATVRRAAKGYIELLKNHIQKEDNVLFMLANQMLGEEEKKSVLAAFDRAERSSGDPGKHERYLKLAESLCQRAGVGDTVPPKGVSQPA